MSNSNTSHNGSSLSLDHDGETGQFFLRLQDMFGYSTIFVVQMATSMPGNLAFLCGSYARPINQVSWYGDTLQSLPEQYPLELEMPNGQPGVSVILTCTVSENQFKMLKAVGLVDVKRRPIKNGW